MNGKKYQLGRRRQLKLGLWEFVLIAIVIGAAMLSAYRANAQMGFGLFDETRAMQVAAPTRPAVNINLVTNGPFDLAPFTGRGVLLLSCLTNGAGPLATGTGFYIYTSPDTTNWYSISNYAISSYQSVAYTNYYYNNTTNNSGLQVTNNYYLPFVPTTPTAFSSLFNTPYPAYQLFTNTLPVVPSLNNQTVVAWNVNDFYRYLYLVTTNAGNATNGGFQFSAVFIGTPKNSQ